MSRKPLYKLTQGDRDIFALARKTNDPNVITNFYLRTPDTGTYWRHVPDKHITRLVVPESREIVRRWQEGHENLMAIWRYLKEPDYFGEIGAENWIKLSAEEYQERRDRLEVVYKILWENTPEPIFHYNHGPMMLNWARDAYRDDSPFQVLPGGVGCIAPDTKIYDAELNQHIPVSELKRMNRAPVVLAWTGERFVKQKATVPFIKGTAALYRVTMASGIEITVTEEHRFLTEKGWKTLAALRDEPDLRLRIYDASRPLSTVGFDLSESRPDAARCPQTPQDSQCDCRLSHCSCDAQPPAAEDSAQDVAPSRSDVQRYSRISEKWDAQAYIGGYSRHHQECVLPSNHGDSPQAANLHQQPEVRFDGRNDEPAQALRVNQVFSQSSGTYTQSRQALGFDRDMDQETMGISENRSLDQILHEGAVLSRQACQSTLQDYVQPSPMCQTAEADPSDCRESNRGIECCACETPGYYHSTNFTMYDNILEVELVSDEAEYYDLHVPMYENYLAEGFINHNSGKTLNISLGYLVRGVLLPGYRALALAPLSKQADEVHKILSNLMQDTEYEKRFLIGQPMKPHPMIIMGHEDVGRNTIECYPILEGTGGLLTMTCDEAMVDQSEQLPDHATLVKDVMTRFRGSYRGRPRRGQITFVANSAENVELWDRYDKGLEPDDETTYSYSPSTLENIYLNPGDLYKFEISMKDDQAKKMYLFGHRPIGSGEHFPGSSLMACRAQWLDDLMDKNLTHVKGWMKVEERGVAVRRWEKPYEIGRRYLVCADPGWGNAPARNSAVIAVWDITDFPKTPAIMVAFNWVDGNGSPNPWLQQYFEYVSDYKAYGMNGFDSTGAQSGYDHMADMTRLGPTPVILGGSKKYIYLTILKKLMADGRFQIPNIVHLFSQLAKYKLPDDGIPQDIVSMLVVTAALLEPYMYEDEIPEESEEGYDPDDRYYRPATEDRYSRDSEER